MAPSGGCVYKQLEESFKIRCQARMRDEYQNACKINETKVEFFPHRLEFIQDQLKFIAHPLEFIRDRYKSVQNCLEFIPHHLKIILHL